MHIIQTIYKSEKEKNFLERLHVAGSKKFMEYMIRNGFNKIYNKSSSFVLFEENLSSFVNAANANDGNNIYLLIIY